MKKNKNTAPRSACAFSCAEVALAAPIEGNENGAFKIVGYTGQVLKHPWWGDIAIDLSGAKFASKKTPVLDSHYNDVRIGFSTKQRIKDDISLEGEFLPNAKAQEMRADVQAGFPMQASVFAVPSVVEELSDGAKAEVNGYTLKGPGRIFRKSIIAEISMCTFGVDGDTKSEALAAKDGQGAQFTYETLNKEKQMSLLEKLAVKLGLKDAEPTEELILSAVDTALEAKPEIKAEAKPETETEAVVLSADVPDPLAKLICDNRAMKLSGLVKAGLLTPAVSDIITAKYVEPKSVALSLKDKTDDGFDILYDVLLQNRPVKLDEVTGVQSLELVNESVTPPNVMEKVVLARRKAAGYKD